MKPPEDPIERYLDRLLLELHGRAGDVRRILAETEAHLRDAAAEGVAAGLGEVEAAEGAISRFGHPRELARHFAQRPLGLPTRPLLEQLVAGILLLGTIGLLAFAASGALAAGFGLAFGKEFVAGDAPGVTYTAARCAQLRVYEPRAASCGQAAVSHRFGEVVANQVTLGVFGLLGAAVYWRVRRRLLMRGATVGLLPDGFVPTIGVSVFGVAGGVFLLQAAGNAATSSGSGNGTLLGEGIAALLAACAFLPALYRTLTLRAALAAPAADDGVAADR